MFVNIKEFKNHLEKDGAAVDIFDLSIVNNGSHIYRLMDTDMKIEISIDDAVRLIKEEISWYIDLYTLNGNSVYSLFD